MEGKEIGQASGFKLVELENLDSGSILKVGGREVLVKTYSKYYFLNQTTIFLLLSKNRSKM